MNAGFIAPAWHEVDVNLVFDDRGDCCSHGLEPFYAASGWSASTVARSGHAAVWATMMSR